MNVGLFFGTFNPIHNGHLILTNYILETSALNEVWFVVSLQSPFKTKSTLLNEYDRLHLVELAIADNYKFRSSNIEFSLPKPSYTIDTLTYLIDKYPDYNFTLLMGEDNLATLPQWKNYEQILKYYNIIVYNRTLVEPSTLLTHPKVKLIEAPQLIISSSFIRNCIKEQISIQYMVPDPVRNYIDEMNLFKV